ncbi:MAG: MBL fold metallo-hydrolase [Proteobacteria bacterium]|nr:MBL fold metallo-hydrolase [Pseudomonadota bacterium]
MTRIAHPGTAFARAGLRVLERGWLSSNNIVLVGSDECVVVDTGYASHAEQTLALVQAALPAGRRLDRIVNTHLHSDHCGGNAMLQRVHGCAIDVPAAAAGHVDRWDEEVLTYHATGQHCERFQRTGVLVPGSTVRLGRLPWDVHAAPGHDPESVVLYQPDVGVLISADALWEDGFGVVFPELVGEPGFDDVRATLDRIASLDVQWVIPGHGAPFSDFRAALERAYRRLDRLAAAPLRHVRHAAKVLIKFHLLEVRATSHDALADWAAAAPYFVTMHGRCFADLGLRAWLAELIAELVASGALSQDSEFVREPDPAQ